MRGAPALRCYARAILVPVVLAALSAGAVAQATASLSVDSDYRFRGVSLSESRPSVQLFLNYDTASGWYAGAAATQVEPARGDRYVWLLGYAGYVTAVVEGHRFEFGASYSHFTGDSGHDFAEPYVGVLFEHWSLRLHYAPDYFGRHVRTAYLDASAQRPLTDHLRLFAHIGVLAPLSRQAVIGNDANRVRADLRVGAGWASDGWDLRVAWVAASSGGPYPALYGGPRSAWLVGASYSF